MVVAIGLALLGRYGLDWLIAHTPKWSTEIEAMGGWVVGLIVVLLVVVPVYKMYGVIGSDSEAGVDGGPPDKGQ